MKRIASFLLAAAMFFSLAACSQADGSEASMSSDSGQYETETAVEDTEDEVLPEEPDEGIRGPGNSNVLVAYFSWADNAILAEDVDAVSSPSVIPPGNVQQLAGWVQEETGGDIFSIRVADPYPSGWDECLERANEERGEDARPELAENAANLGQYDTVFLGYPNWWYVDAEDFSTNEKVFYPPKELAGVETPAASSSTGAGTLAYYEPWGNVVMFYDGFNENPSLYELGYAVSGAEQISRLSGTITVEAIE